LSRQLKQPTTGGEALVASVAAGLREAHSQPVVRAVLIITVVMNVLVFPYQQMLPVLARDFFRVGPELLGLLIAADGLGSLCGGLVLASWRGFKRHRELFVGGSLFAAGLVIAMAATPWYWLSLPVQAGIGLASFGFGTMQSTIVLLAAPERARGRAMGI